MTTLKTLFRVLSLTRNQLWVIIIYGASIGFISLVVPIAAQSLVTIVSFGSVLQPLFVLAAAVFILLVSSSILRILQVIFVENIQQRIFADVAIKLANRLPHVNIDFIDGYRSTELVNRFFDVVTLQKTSAMILLSGAGVFLQGLFGLLLLAFYHPFLLIFDIVFIICLLLVVILPFKAAASAALKESDAKYEVAAWLEEILHVPLFFRFQNYERFAFKYTDQKVSTYLLARQKHFHYLLYNIGGSYLLQILASTLLLLIGGLLVINNQMTLGQLVASEIVISALGANVSKLGKYLEDIYDLLAAAKKVDFLLELPIEHKSLSLDHPHKSPKAFAQAPKVTIKDLVVITSPLHQQGFNVELLPHEKAVLFDDHGVKKSLLLDAILGLREPIAGYIAYNDISLKEYALEKLRKKICFIRGPQFFDDTILNNLLVGNEHIASDEIRNLLNEFGLENMFAKLPQGLNSKLAAMQQVFSATDMKKLILIRAILAKPYFLVIDETLDTFSPHELSVVMPQLLNPSSPWTLLVSTRRKDIAEYFNKQIV